MRGAAESEPLGLPNVLQRRNLDLSALPDSQAAGEGRYGLLKNQEETEQALCLSWVSQDAENLLRTFEVSVVGNSVFHSRLTFLARWSRLAKKRLKVLRGCRVGAVSV
eukprot:763232-Hanusia_phi.AAC.3